MTRKASPQTVWVLFCFVIALVFGLVGCDEAQDEDGDSLIIPTTTGSITLLFGVNGTEMAGYTALAEAFTADNPDVHIQLVSIDGRLPPGNAPTATTQLRK